MFERAQDFILQNEIKTEGLGDMAENEDEICVTAVLHPDAASRTVGVVNKTNDYLKVRIDMTQSRGVKFTPTSGIVTKVIAPGTLRYMCSAILDPTADGGSINVEKSYERYNAATSDDQPQDVQEEFKMLQKMANPPVK